MAFMVLSVPLIRPRIVLQQNDKGQQDEICGDVVKYEVGVVILPSKVHKVQSCVEPPSDDSKQGLNRLCLTLMIDISII